MNAPCTTSFPSLPSSIPISSLSPPLPLFTRSTLKFLHFPRLPLILRPVARNDRREWAFLFPTRRRRRMAGGVSMLACSMAASMERNGDRKEEEEKEKEKEKKSFWKWIPKGGPGPENILRLIAGATSSPICQFIDSPVTFLHSVDSRIKLVWLLALVVVPARSHILMRFGIVIYLAILSILVLPARIWTDQLGRVSLLSGILFLMLGLGADGAPPLVQSRTPPASMLGLPTIPPSLEGYSYLIMKLGPLQFTRKGLSVASMSACLSFTILQSASICLATTTPEQLASALRWFMHPLTLVGVPVAEIILTLLLSLRFINIVFDEVRNAALGIIARRIQWNQLTLMETVDVFVTYVRRIFKNIFSHAEQISQAMIVRGFRGDSKTHRIYLFSNSSLGMQDFISLSCLAGLIAAAIFCEWILI